MSGFFFCAKGGSEMGWFAEVFTIIGAAYGSLVSSYC